jgi:hypothetical protein
MVSMVSWMKWSAVRRYKRRGPSLLGAALPKGANGLFHTYENAINILAEEELRFLMSFLSISRQIPG